MLLAKPAAARPSSVARYRGTAQLLRVRRGICCPRALLCVSRCMGRLSAIRCGAILARRRRGSRSYLSKTGPSLRRLGRFAIARGPSANAPPTVVGAAGAVFANKYPQRMDDAATLRPGDFRRPRSRPRPRGARSDIRGTEVHDPLLKRRKSVARPPREREAPFHRAALRLCF